MAAAVCAGALSVGCASAVGTGPASLGPDQPVAAEEPRAEIVLRLDLNPVRDCEERFDLALYEHRAVELVAWDEHHERCERRQAVIRYLSRHLAAQEIVDAARALALRVEQVPQAPPAAPPPGQ